MAPFYDSHLGTVAIAGSQMHSGVQMQPNLSSASRHSSRMESTNPCAKAGGDWMERPPTHPWEIFANCAHFRFPIKTAGGAK